MCPLQVGNVEYVPWVLPCGLLGPAQGRRQGFFRTISINLILHLVRFLPPIVKNAHRFIAHHLCSVQTPVGRLQVEFFVDEVIVEASICGIFLVQAK